MLHVCLNEGKTRHENTSFFACEPIFHCMHDVSDVHIHDRRLTSTDPIHKIQKPQKRRDVALSNEYYIMATHTSTRLLIAATKLTFHRIYQ